MELDITGENLQAIMLGKKEPNMKLTHSIVGLFSILAAIQSPSAHAEAPPGVSIQVISTFDYPGTGNLTRPQKISYKGDIVGSYIDSSGASRGFIMFGGTGNFSPPLVDPNDTGNLTEGRGINNSRLVCGDYLDSSSGTFHGFFAARGSYMNYDVPGSTTTIVLGVNNAGDFCGSDTPASGIQGAFLSIGGTVTEFAIPNASASLAYQINEVNQSCGYYVDSSTISHGFFRDSDGSIRAPLDYPGSTSTIIFGNNNKNWMVGRWTDYAGATHGFLLILPNKFLNYDYPGSTFTSLNGINTQGLVVGRYLDSSGFEHGILAQVVRGAAD
jgi:hypothetical protein